MKWIGQHIWDFISRFRSKVYLEDVDNAGLDTDAFLVKKSNGEIAVRTGTEVLSDIGAASSASDITAVTITTDSGGGSRATDDSGSADFSILGSSGVGVTNSGVTITVTSVPGEIDHDSLLNYAANEHYTQANIVATGTIASGTWQGTAVASAYLDADTAHLTTNQTFTGIKTIVARRFTISSSTDHNYLGDIVTFGTADGSLAQGDVCYLHTDASWVPALAGSDNAGTGKLLGIALGADPSADGMLLRGMITLDHNTGDSNDGEPIYLSTSSAGSVTSTLPNSSGNIVRILGYKMGDDDQVWFNPDSTYIERA